MNTKALLATLVVIGSSTAALADPIRVDHRDADDRRDIDGQRMRDHRRLPAWKVLSASGNLADGRDYVRPAQTPVYTQLKLQLTSGKLQIARVQIKFANGETQLVSPSSVLTTNNPSLTIDLAGNARHITSIAVFGKSGRRASYEILGA